MSCGDSLRSGNFVVTGGAGFIGSHLCDALAERGARVTVLDDLSTGRMENIESLLRTRDVRFVHGSVTDLPLLLDSFRGVQYVFHLASLASVALSIDNPQATHEANATGTLNVLIAARRNNVKGVVFSSSSSVYGDSAALSEKEDMQPRPQSPYAVTKLTGELYCSVYQQVYALPTACLRYFNVYGPRQDPDSQYAAVIPKFIRSVHDQKAPLVFGDGNQTRDFVFVRDAVAANILAMEAELSGVFNVGTSRSVTINELASLVMRLLKGNGGPAHVAARTGDIRHSVADISRIKACGYQPRYNLEEGLKETIGALGWET